MAIVCSITGLAKDGVDHLDKEINNANPQVQQRS